MNEEIVLKMIEPYVKNGTVTYREFDSVYDVLSLHEQYQVVEILYNHGIELKDTSISETDGEMPELIALTTDGEDVLAEEAASPADDFRILYDEGIFKDTKTADSSEEVFLYKNIKQSNEILCQLVQAGNLQARQDLCVKNERLIAKYANLYYRYYGNSLELDDLMQAGYMGLLRAAESYDISRDTAFSTYAVFWIKQAILREIMDNGFTIGLPVHMIEKIVKVTRLDNTYGAQGLEYKERMEAIAADLGYTVQQVRNYIALRIQFLSSVSLNTPVGEEADSELEEFIEDTEQAGTEDVIMQKALSVQIREILDTLTPREARILRLRFGIDDGKNRTLEEVGQEFNVTRERIRQIEAKALRKLRHPSRSKKIKEFLE